MTIKSGAKVRQIVQAPITGTVVERRFSDSHDEMEYGVQTEDGTLLYFRESQLEVDTKEEA